MATLQLDVCFKHEFTMSSIPCCLKEVILPKNNTKKQNTVLNQTCSKHYVDIIIIFNNSKSKKFGGSHF